MSQTNDKKPSRSLSRTKRLEEVGFELESVEATNTENNLEWDLLTCEWMCEKAKQDPVYAQNLYASMCNNTFQKLDVMIILKEHTWSCSWRCAGGIVADMREHGDYIDWYCSGMQDYDVSVTQPNRGYVPESTITHEIQHDLKALGWVIIQDD